MPGHPISSRKSQFPIGTLIMAIAAILLRAKRKKSRRIRSPIFSVLKPAIPSELPESFCSNPGNIPSSFSQKVFLRAPGDSSIPMSYSSRKGRESRLGHTGAPNPPCPATSDPLLLYPWPTDRLNHTSGGWAEGRMASCPAAGEHWVPGTRLGQLPWADCTTFNGPRS